MTAYVCPVCDYVYYEAKGAAREGFPAGTRWDQVPDDWCCPDCGVREKIDFEKASEATGDDQEASEATGDDHEASEATGNDHEASEATGNDHEASEATGDDHEASEATGNQNEIGVKP